ncbi:hypothetical protein [Daejeonella sp. H1SJ63]|uniref:hypothetical protein n=1 Tax=Daejeonella sp. H1SJ63 TaxID=3034145 RepID=UPI0023ECF6EC|nr:hypothetical protein [Daejeonella sp. H1SJ63]
MAGVFGVGKVAELDVRREIDKLREELKLKDKQKKRPKATLPVQLLMLHYLGFLEKYELSNTKKAQLFSFLLNGDSQNIREQLPNFIENQLRNPSNEKHLMELSELFKQLKLNEISQLIEKDLIKLRTGK